MIKAKSVGEIIENTLVHNQYSYFYKKYNDDEEKRRRVTRICDKKIEFKHYKKFLKTKQLEKKVHFLEGRKKDVFS